MGKQFGYRKPVVDFAKQVPVSSYHELKSYIQKIMHGERMRARNKFGVQNKIPRLANHRQYLEEILRLVKENA